MEIDAFKMDKEISQKYLSGDFSDLLNAIKYAEKHEPRGLIRFQCWQRRS